MLAGFQVWEALAVSEVLFLCETEEVNAVVIAADVDLPDLPEITQRFITFRLKPEATSKDVIWELSQLFPGDASRVQ